ncbi:MAG: NAD(P)-dependent oxidoreductase [Gemmatimonadetes bacterium]|jgi:nucleoside-diphosphate-sugar epimerase|nr:NAD(P)-dependent oxidoreductase [Gemmatimonadota bacterium]
MAERARSVAVTGALGNLGWKLLCHLAEHSASTRLIGLDNRKASPAQEAELRRLPGERPVDIDLVECDLADGQDRRWRDAIDQVEAVVHFAYRSPFPNDTWDDANLSFDMTLNAAQAAADSPAADRFVFATSNHVMGRYKDLPLAKDLGPGDLHPELTPGVGTRWHTGTEDADASIYATHKWAGERLCRALGQRAAAQTTFACIRIGWCQPSENLPTTLSGTGSHFHAQSTAAASETDRWFKEMWLSNRDFCQLFQRATEADSDTWPDGSILVHGISNNANMKWNIDATREYLGYQPQDDVYAG